MQFEWDPDKDERNRQSRGFGFDFAALIFEGDILKWPDARYAYGEIRVRAIGEVDGFILHVVFTDRGDLRRIIPARIADRKERALWRRRR